MLSQRQAIEFLLKLPLLGRLGPVFLRYLLVGGLGFLADALLLEIFVRLGVSVYIARILSMTLAMGCTYALHRNFTFADAAKPQKTVAQVVAFVTCQLFAAAVNYGVFCWLLWLLPQPVEFFGRMFALCWGVGAGLAVNFVLLRLLVFPAGGEAPYEKFMPKSPAHVLPWVLALSWLFQRALMRQEEVKAWPQAGHEIGPADPDVWMRLAQLRDWMAGSDFFSHAVNRTNAPIGGIETHWTRPMDFLLVLFTKFMPGGIDVKLMLAAAWLPPVLGLIALAFLICAAEKRFTHMHVVWCVLLLAAFGPGQAYFAPGDADHHGLLAMLWCGVLCFIMRPLDYVGAAFAGIFLGAMVWISIEALLPLAAVLAVLGWFTLKKPDEIKPLSVLTITTALTSAFGLFIEMPASKIFTQVSYDTLSIAHVALLSFIALGASVLALPKIRNLPLPLRATCAFNAGVLAFLFEIVLFPKIMFGPMVDTDFFITQNFLGAINEAMSMFDRSAAVILSHFWQPILAACLLLPVADDMKSDLKKRQVITLGALLAAGFLMVAAQGRWTYYLQPVAIITIAAFLPALAVGAKTFFFGWLKRMEKPLRPYAFLLGAAISVAGLTMFISAAINSVGVMCVGCNFPPSREELATCQSQMRHIVQTKQLQKKLSDAPLTLYTQPELGGDMLFFTPYKIIAGNYHREGEGLRALSEIANETKPEIAQKRLGARQVHALFFCPSTQDDKSWLRRLSPARHPDWLTPVGGLKYLEIAGPKPLLFLVEGGN